MYSSAECARCEGSGMCRDCNGSGTNPHLNSADPKCPECSATGRCSECDGTGKSPSAMPLYQGSLLKHGVLWAGVAIAVWSGTVLLFAKSRFFGLIAIVIWTVSWCLMLYRNARRYEHRR
jgi:hypothetical protein